MTADRWAPLLEQAHRIVRGLPLLLTLMLLTAVIALIATLYVGNASSPYGMCYGDNGRPLPCELAKKGR